MSNTEKRITAKMVLDDSGYSNTLKGINSELKNNKSELKAASSGLEAYGKTTGNVERVQASLQKQLELQAKKVEVYKESLQKATETLEKNVTKRDSLKQSLEQEKTKLEALKKTYGDNNEAVTNSEKKLAELQEQYDKVDSSIENNAKRIQNYQTQINKAEDEMNRATSAINKFNSELKNNSIDNYAKKLNDIGNNFKNAGEKAEKVGRKLTTNVTVPLTGIGVAATHVGMNFEEQMDKVAAISGATGEDFEKLEAKAEEMGAKTKFSATNAAEGLEFMSMAGWKTQDMLDGLEPVLNLAIASGADLGTTSDIVTDALTAFGLTAKDATMFTDVLAVASSNANTNVEMMGNTFQYAAPVAGALGFSIQDVALATGLMANAGIKADKAGTALRGGLTNLVKPTDSMAAAMERYNITVTNSDGTMKSFRQIIEDLRYKLGNLDEATQANVASTIFGKEAMSGWLAIINASPTDFDKLSNAIADCDGATAKMAETMSDNAKGSISEMKSALEGAAIKVFKALAPIITDVANSVSELANKFSQLSPETQEFIVKAGLVAAVGGPVISTIGKTTSGIGDLIKTYSKFKSLKAVESAVDLGKILVGVGGASEVAGVGLAGAGTAASGLGAAIAGMAGPIAVGTIAVGAVAYAGYKVYESLTESATPAVDLFADKAVYSSQEVETAYGTMTTQVQTDTIKISESTKTAVQSYLDLDQQASEALLNVRINSDNFTKEAKDEVIKNFTEMSKKSSNLSQEQRNNMTVEFKKLVSDTNTLTTKNKEKIIQKYREMVNGTTDLSQEQKNKIIKDFSDTLYKTDALTKQQAQKLQKNYKDMANKVLAEIDNKEEKEIKSQQEFFNQSNALTEHEEKEILRKTKQHWEDRRTTINNYQERINEIIQKAADNNREITEQEAKTIDRLQKEMKEKAIKTLSDNEVEAKVILERMKDYDANITAEQASQHIKTLNDSRDKAVSAAKDECDKRIAEIIRMRDEMKVVSADQADALIADAKTQRDETIAAAEETRNEAVNKITSMNADIKDDVDIATGEVLTKWDKFKNWWHDLWFEPKTTTVTTNYVTKYSDGRGGYEENWTGNSYFKGGFTTLHERGYELYDLPSGTRIYNHESSEAMVKETAEQVARNIVSEMNVGESGEIQVIIKNYLDSKEISSETTKEVFRNMNNRNSSRNLLRGGRSNG